jgi:hypothetical protein
MPQHQRPHRAADRTFKLGIGDETETAQVLIACSQEPLASLSVGHPSRGLE